MINNTKENKLKMKSWNEGYSLGFDEGVQTIFVELREYSKMEKKEIEKIIKYLKKQILS